MRANAKKPHGRRVERILHLLLTADAQRIVINRRAFPYGLTLPEDGVYSYSSKRSGGQHSYLDGHLYHDPLTNHMHEEYEAAVIELHEALARYQWRPVVRAASIHGLEYVNTWETDNPEISWENRAVQWLLANLRGGSDFNPSPVSRIRKCKDCSKWFASMTDHQQFCGDACRKHFSSQSQEFKEKRRIYMRERYRPLQKDLERQALERAKAKGKTTKGAK
jgi:hypothetical protein